MSPPTSVVAGIVTFNPDPHILRSNLDAILPQADAVAVFDNGSQHLDVIAQITERYPTVAIQRNPSNRGIAFALNWLTQWGSAQGARWLVTLDQDSVAGPDMVRRMLSVGGDISPLITPFIVDRNKLTAAQYFAMNLPELEYYRRAAWRGAITSGAVMRLDVVEEVGGFDDSMFIDYVDYDFNQRVMLAGYSIVRVNAAYLSHAVGEASRTPLRVPRRDFRGTWHLERVYSFGHSADRCYYKARNRVVFTRKYIRRIGLTNEGVFQVPQQVALTVLLEDDRWNKLRQFCRGFLDGWTMPIRRPAVVTPARAR